MNFLHLHSADLFMKVNIMRAYIKLFDLEASFHYIIFTFTL